MTKVSPLVVFTEEDINRIKSSSTSGSVVVTKLIERLETKLNDPDTFAHNSHQSHNRTR